MNKTYREVEKEVERLKFCCNKQINDYKFTVNDTSMNFIPENPSAEKRLM